MGAFKEVYLVATACTCEAEESDDIGLLAGDVAVASYTMDPGGARAAAGARRGRPPRGPAPNAQARHQGLPLWHLR
jgi:hypothetical protein